MLQGETPPRVEFWSLFAVTSSWAIHKFQFPVKYLFAAAQGCWRLKCAEHCDDLDICDSTGNIVMVRDRVYIMVVKLKVTQSCQTLCNPHGLYSPWNSPGQNTGVGSLSLLQGIFPTQGSNPGLLHCRQIFYQLSHKGSPRILEWVAYPFSRGLSNPGIKPGSPALQVDSLPTEISGNGSSNIII